MKFIEDVVSGKLLLGNYARLAVERHLNDLKNKDWEYTRENGPELGKKVSKS